MDVEFADMSFHVEKRVTKVPITYREMFAFLLKGSGIWAMLLLFLLAGTWKSISGGWAPLDLFIIGGFVVFRGIIEWGVHAWLYHCRPLPLLGIRIVSGANKDHIAHHEDPFDLSKLLVTWKGVFILSGFLFLLTLAVSRSSMTAAAFVIGFVLVALITEMVHLLCHCRIPHRSGFLQRLVALHRQHHHQDGTRDFGVSSSLGDRLFGTSSLCRHSNEPFV